jgi:hypothetical protein
MEIGECILAWIVRVIIHGHCLADGKLIIFGTLPTHVRFSIDLKPVPVLIVITRFMAVIIPEVVRCRSAI